MALKVKVFTFRFHLNAVGPVTDQVVTDTINQFLIDENIRPADFLSLDTRYDSSFEKKEVLQTVIIIFN